METAGNFGELLPLGGGDPIPLLKQELLVGRRESCDIVLRFPNVSAHHCKLFVQGGYWYVRDLESKNGVKVNGIMVTQHYLTPGDELSISRHKFEIQYAPLELGAVGPPPEDGSNDIFEKSLLERAGLQKPPREKPERKQRAPDKPTPQES